MRNGSIPRLYATSRPLAQTPEMRDLIGLAHPVDPLLWVRQNQGFVGIGEALRADFQGADRFAAASAWWRDITAAATIDDAVKMPGAGLITFGTIAFDDHSTAISTFIVPRIVIARDNDCAWITEIALTPQTPTSAAALDAVAGISATADSSAHQSLRDFFASQSDHQPGPTPSAWAGTQFDVHTDDTEYFAGVAEATRRTATESIEKIVIARRVISELAADDDLRVPLARLAERYADCWTFAVDGLIGASPETLMRNSQGTVSARILAGTRGRDVDPAADERARVQLLESEKEQHEHAYAVQSVVTALGPHVNELECDEEPFALKLPNVWHLATDLQAVPRETGGVLQLAGVVHPTAAVAGTPTADAIAAIAELEPFDRGRYAGTVGWIDGSGDGEWMIALRCAQLGEITEAKTRTITAYAGGGILADSDARHEFNETVSKLRPIVEAFAP